MLNASLRDGSRRCGPGPARHSAPDRGAATVVRELVFDIVNAISDRRNVDLVKGALKVDATCFICLNASGDFADGIGD